MTTTPRGAPELVSGQAVPETTVNEQIRRTEAGAGRFPVADRVTAPPGTCADGANYIIIATATGAFTGKEGQIATAVGTNAASGWYYRVLGAIDEGVLAYVQDEDAEYKWSGSAWAAAVAGGGALIASNNLSDVANAGTSRTNLGATTVGANVFTLTNPSAITFLRLNADNTVSALSASAFRTAIGAGSGSGDLVSTNNLSDVASASTSRTNLGLGSIATFAEATAAQFQANTSGKALSTDKIWSAADLVALTDAATVAVDMSTFLNASVTLGGNRTLGNPSNTKNGQTGVIKIVQDGTGSRTLAYSSNWKFAGGTAPTLTTTASAVDLLFYQVISSTLIYATLVKDVK